MSCNFSGASQSSGWVEKASSYAVNFSSSTQHDDRWAAAELRIAELLSRVEPNEHSERRRKDVADYVKGLIHERLDCQVFNFGSVPLKTYLPDGDIDLTTFSKHPNVKDTWVNDVLTILRNEEQREGARFCVREVQCIPAEVKIIKCLVENILVDISFNQLGGLCTLCFLEEVDRLIQKDHLFKRSIILVKAWCYYESRLLGAHHGLISAYALEILVLYIFNVFHSSLRGPLEVLFTFLDYFSNFDWDKYCISVWGPIPLASISDLRESPFVKDDELLLSKDFLEACRAKYDATPKGQDPHERLFNEKFLNVLDPLQGNNNLGRSVSKANFFRVRGALNLGARKLAKVFEVSDNEFPMYLDNFFCNTWERHRCGARRDAPDSFFAPFHSLVYKVDDLNLLHDGSTEDSHVSKTKFLDSEPHIHDTESKDSDKIFAGGTCSQNCSLALMPAEYGLNNYKENASPSDINVILRSKDFLTKFINSTESQSLAYNPRQAAKATLRRTVSESKLEKLSRRKPFSEDAPRNVTKLGTKVVDINNFIDASKFKHTVRDVTNCTLSRDNAASYKCKSMKQQIDPMQVGDKIAGESKYFQDTVPLTNVVHDTHERTNVVTRYPDSKFALRPHDQGSTVPSTFASMHTLQPSTIRFSPSPEFTSSTRFPELNRSKSNDSSSLTISVPSVSPIAHVQFPHISVPVSNPYTTGIAAISPSYPSGLQGKQDMRHIWCYPNASLSASQVQHLRNLSLVDIHPASTASNRQVSLKNDNHHKRKDDVKGHKASSIEDVRAKSVQEYNGPEYNIARESCGVHDGSQEGQQFPISCSAADSEACVCMQFPSLRTADSCFSTMVDFPGYCSSRKYLADSSLGNQVARTLPMLKVPNTNVDTLRKPSGYQDSFMPPVVQLSSPTEGTVPGISMHFPVGTIPIFSYYDPFQSATSNINNDMDAVKDLSHYNRQGYGQSPYSVNAEYASHGIEQKPNHCDSASTAIESSVHEATNASGDLLSSDLLTHLQHLKFGRSCQELVLDPPSTNHINNSFVWKEMSCVPIQGTANFTQGSNFLNSTFTFNHVSTELPQPHACSFNDTHQQRIGAPTFLPYGHGFYSNTQCYAGNCPQVAEQYDHRYKNAPGGDKSNMKALSLVTNSSHFRVAEGKSGDRNFWRKSRQPMPSYSPISSALVVPPLNSPYKGLPGIHAAGNHIYEPGIPTGVSPHFSGRALPAVPQLEFGSFGPMTVITSSGDSGPQPARFSMTSGHSSRSSGRDVKKPVFHSGCR